MALELWSITVRRRMVMISHVVADKELHTFILKLINKGLLKETKTNQKIFHALP
jgi:hypothetical protein